MTIQFVAAVVRQQGDVRGLRSHRGASTHIFMVLMNASERISKGDKGHQAAIIYATGLMHRLQVIQWLLFRDFLDTVLRQTQN